MQSKDSRIIYIGTLDERQTRNPTTAVGLISVFKSAGFTVYSASKARSKGKRLAAMLWTVLCYGTKNTIVVVDTYSTQSFYYALAVGILCRIKGLRYVPILHGGDLPKRLSQSPALAKFYFSNASVTVAPSPYLAEWARAHGFKSTVIPNGLDLTQYPYNGQRVKNHTVLWVRALAAIYQPQLALEVLQLLQNKYKEARMIMVGPDKEDLLKSCQDHAEKHALNVQFVGKQSKAQWIERSQEASVFINTSRVDNTPMSVVEAMALGLPVVSTDVGGLPYLITHGVNGFLVPSTSAQGFADKVSALWDDEVDVHLLGQNARQKSLQSDWPSVQALWQTLINDLKN